MPWGFCRSWKNLELGHTSLGSWNLESWDFWSLDRTVKSTKPVCAGNLDSPGVMQNCKEIELTDLLRPSPNWNFKRMLSSTVSSKNIRIPLR
jgi:hypothetical protein